MSKQNYAWLAPNHIADGRRTSTRPKYTRVVQYNTQHTRVLTGLTGLMMTLSLNYHVSKLKATCCTNIVRPPAKGLTSLAKDTYPLANYEMWILRISSIYLGVFKTNYASGNTIDPTRRCARWAALSLFIKLLIILWFTVSNNLFQKNWFISTKC